MPGIDNVGVAFKALLGSISHERKAIISTLNNGFAGWLKLEFYTWLIQEYRLDYTAPHCHEYASTPHTPVIKLSSIFTGIAPLGS